ncbi:MAG: ABC transporter permease subunit [Lachnospiraceae bacterium]|nr:ABC transporter permease subunit [Lachnospiraceae bacterium]
MVLFLHECKLNRKSLLVWSLCVGILCFACLLLYDSLADSMGGVSEMFSEMGAFSAALGMDKVNIGTLEGYYAVEIAIMLSLGGGLFAAMTGSALVAKEEEGHTAEFLNTLPLSRTEILLAKYAAMVFLIFSFSLITLVCVLAGFSCMGEMPHMTNLLRYHGAAFLMQLEIGSICFFLSAICRKKPTGAALGLTIFFYMLDLLLRVVPALKPAKYITPFYYANASDIFSESAVHLSLLLAGAGACVVFLAVALSAYRRRDIAG